MRFKSVLVVLLWAASARAGEPRRQSGVLLQMDSVQCTSRESSASPSAGAALVATSTPGNIQASFCQEYVLQSDRVTFHIRPRDPKHAILLPIGGIALFRLQENKMILRAADLDDKDREYSVVSMTPREAQKLPDTPMPKLNHLQ